MSDSKQPRRGGEADCDRRELLIGALGLPLLASCRTPASSLGEHAGTDAAFKWRNVREAFDFAPGSIALNAANLCPASRPVRRVQLEIMQAIDRDPSFENRLGFEALRERSRARIAVLLGANVDEIAITRNTSESNHAVISGLDFSPGDRVLLWEQNHESNLDAWRVAAKRHGFEVITVSTPEDPANADMLLAPFRQALGGHVRVIAFSHVSNLSGVKLPARELCALARQHGALSLVDGAQSLGVMQLDLHGMGCDFFAASAHKWLAGPRECGVLYVRDSARAGLWPGIVTHGWTDERERSARKFDCLGQQDDARIAALATAVDFHDEIGRARIEARILSLNAHLRRALADRVPDVRIVTPSSADMSGGITVFTVPVADAELVRRTLYERRRIFALAVPFKERTLLRFCPHIYTTTDELDAAVAAVAQLSERAMKRRA